jgi:hypothetical protein
VQSAPRFVLTATAGIDLPAFNNNSVSSMPDQYKTAGPGFSRPLNKTNNNNLVFWPFARASVVSSDGPTVPH